MTLTLHNILRVAGLLALLLVGSAAGAVHRHVHAAPSPVTVDDNYANAGRLVVGHWSEDSSLMLKQHKPLLLERMHTSAYDVAPRGVLALESCVLCHVVRDENRRPVDDSDGRHFCRACHARAGLRIRCFTCHASLPATDALIADPDVRNSDQVRERLEQWRLKGGRVR